MPILDPHTLDFLSHGAGQTQRYGVRLGELLEPGDLVCLSGGLGAGKTCLSNGIGRGFGIAEPLTSPTFTLMNEYRRPGDGRTIVHVDCYRLAVVIYDAETGEPVTGTDANGERTGPLVDIGVWDPAR